MLPYVKQWSPTFLAQGTSFMQESFSAGVGGGGWFGMIQAHYIYYALYLDYYISSISDHQALDPRGQGLLMQGLF